MIDDYHDIHQVRNPINENLSNVAHMATTMISTPSVPSIPFLSPLFEPVHNPLNVDTDLLSWVLRIDHMSSLGVSYIEKKSTWFCVSNNTNLNEETLINHLTVHSYDPDLQEAHPEKKRMRYTKLINFILKN